MPETAVPAVDSSAHADLISFLKAIPEGRFRRGVRYPQWFLLLVAVLAILTGCRSFRDLEAFAKRHREALNQALGLDFKRWPSDAPFFVPVPLRGSLTATTRPACSNSARCSRLG